MLLKTKTEFVERWLNIDKAFRKFLAYSEIAQDTGMQPINWPSTRYRLTHTRTDSNKPNADLCACVCVCWRINLFALLICSSFGKPSYIRQIDEMR